MITAEILTTGDELLRGDVINTNAAWLATRLKQLGVALLRVVTVGDALEGLTAAVAEALPRCDVLLVSGGLGPTADDRTTEAVAQAAGGLPLELHEEALRAIRERFARGNYPLTPNNEKQALLPRGATLLPNARGTAPGFLLVVGRCRVICLPGVPHELFGMFDEEVVPRLGAELSLSPALIRTLNVFGLGESQMDHRLADLLDCVPAGSCEATLHYRTSFPENRLILVVRPGADGADAAALLDRLEREARARLGHHVFGVDEQSFAGAVVDALRAAGATLALAESCTGGQAGDLITSAAGSSDVFGLGVVSYSNAFKQRVLGVPEEVLRVHGAVSRECVEAMARGVRGLAGATYGVAISGVAGPGGGTEQKPVGTVHFALASAARVRPAVPAGPSHGRQAAMSEQAARANIEPSNAEHSTRVRHLHRVFPFDRPRVKKLAAYTALALVLHECRCESQPLAPDDNDVGRDDPLEGRWAPRPGEGKP